MQEGDSVFMPAQVFTQDAKIKELFRKAIQAKVESARAQMMDNIDEALPSWVSWAFKPIASAGYDLIRFRDNVVGSIGETKAAAALRLILPSEYIVVNDMVLEVDVDEFIQVDHVVIAPSGVFLVETKAWQGAFLCNKGTWRRKQGNSWVRCKSPTAQNRRHRDLFVRWARREIADLPAGDWVYPLILFTAASWLKVNNGEMPVFDSCPSLAWHIRKESAGTALTGGVRKRIVDSILSAKPIDRSLNTEAAPQKDAAVSKTGLVSRPAVTPETLRGSRQGTLPRAFKEPTVAGGRTPTRGRASEKRAHRPPMAPGKQGPARPLTTETSAPVSHPPSVQEGKTRQGRHYVRIRGNREEAEGVRKEYAARGLQPEELKADRRESGVWFFYVK
jgi:hypothetical protein